MRLSSGRPRPGTTIQQARAQPYWVGACIRSQPRSSAVGKQPEQHRLYQSGSKLCQPVWAAARPQHEHAAHGQQQHERAAAAVRVDMDVDEQFGGAEVAGAAVLGSALLFRGSRGGKLWRIRPFQLADKAAVLRLQTDAFHQPSQLRMLDGLTYKIFQAEVMDALNQKIKYNSDSSFVMLVAEPVPPEQPGGPASGPVAGVVEVSIAGERDVVRELRQQGLVGLGSDTYCYVASMAVCSTQRRQGLATGLLQAAEAQARLWREQDLALFVYQDNASAVQLYKQYGLRLVWSDPSWMKVMGTRIKLLMHKPVRLGDEGERQAGGEEEPALDQGPGHR